MANVRAPALRRLRSTASDMYHLLTDRRHREFRAHRRIVDLDARNRAADSLTTALPHSHTEALTPHAKDAAQLNQNGFVFLDGLVTAQQVADIKAYFAELPAYDPYRRELGTFRAPGEVPPVTHVSHYSNELIVEAPHLLAIANDPRVLAVVESFLGAKPTIGAMRVWWSTPSASGEPEHAEQFHRDIDDLRFVKLFVYLTDVDDESGPHIYAAGSHRHNVLTKPGRFTDQEVADAVGEHSIRRMTGPAGTAFLENTYGIHRGLPPIARPRLIFQPLYTLRPVIFGPAKPVRTKRQQEAKLDSYVNRVFLRA